MSASSSDTSDTYLLALDQGTSSSRAILFCADGRIAAMAQRELPQIYPRPGWVEHDALQIWRDQLATAREVLQQVPGSAARVRAIGITNQRETTIVWDKNTGEPVYNDVRAWVRCAVIGRMDAGGSTVIAAHALQAQLERDVAAGEHGDALVYHNRTWHRLGDHSRLV